MRTHPLRPPPPLPPGISHISLSSLVLFEQFGSTSPHFPLWVPILLIRSPFQKSSHQAPLPLFNLYCHSFLKSQLLMSPRVTRSAARLAAEPPPSGTSSSIATPAAGSASTRKRKAPARSDRPVTAAGQPTPSSPSRRNKRQRRTSPKPTPAPVASSRSTRNRPAMSQPG